MFRFWLGAVIPFEWAEVSSLPWMSTVFWFKGAVVCFSFWVSAKVWFEWAVFCFRFVSAIVLSKWAVVRLWSMKAKIWCRFVSTVIWDEFVATEVHIWLICGILSLRLVKGEVRLGFVFGLGFVKAVVSLVADKVQFVYAVMVPNFR